VKTLSKNIVWQKNLAYRKLQCKPFTSVAAPGPTKSGITSACNKYAEAVSGDGCASFAQEHGVTTTELYAWNTMRGTLCWEVVDQIVQRRCGQETTTALVLHPSHNVNTRSTLVEQLGMKR
jgi:LysM repeat protein